MEINVEQIYSQYNQLEFNLDNEELTESELNYLDSLSDEELNSLAKQLEDNGDYYDSLQMGQKLILNSIYGAFGNEHFVCSDVNIAGGITAMGRHLIKFVDKINEDYWYNYWHIDYELHKKLGLNSDDIKPIDPTWVHRESKTLWEDEVTDELVEDGTIQRKFPTSVYIDTDSVDKNTIIRTNKGIMSVEDLYAYSEQFGNAGDTLSGHESVNTDVKVLNYSDENKLYYAPVKRIIRHKVNKPKYKLKTKSGKTVYVTSDHSLVVYRNNKQVVVKPNEIKSGDKVLSIK